MNDTELEYLPPYTATYRNGNRVYDKKHEYSWVGKMAVGCVKQAWRSRAAGAVLALSAVAGGAGYHLGGGTDLSIIRHPISTMHELQADFNQLTNHPVETALAQLNRLGK